MNQLEISEGMISYFDFMILTIFIKKIKKKINFWSKSACKFFSDLFWLKRMVASWSAIPKTLITEKELKNLKTLLWIHFPFFESFFSWIFKKFYCFYTLEVEGINNLNNCCSIQYGKFHRQNNIAKASGTHIQSIFIFVRERLFPCVMFLHFVSAWYAGKLIVGKTFEIYI